MRLLEQITQRILQDILAGRFKPDARIPSQRTLARELNCSQLTINRALANLAARGYLTQRHGSGTYLHPHLPDHDTRALRLFCDKPGIFQTHLAELALESGFTADWTSDPAHADLALLTHIKFAWSRSKLTDLQPLINSDSPILESIAHCPSAQALELDRAQHGVPILYLPYLLFCRKDLFDACHVSLPANKIAWDVFLDRAARLTNTSHNIRGFAWQPMITAALPFLHQCGGGLLRKEPDNRLHSLIDLPGSQKTIAAWRKLGTLTKWKDDANSPSPLGNAKNDFLAGRAAMFISSSNFAASLAQLNAFPWQALPLPDLGDHCTDGATILASVGQNARHPREGIKLIETLLSPVWQQRLAGRFTGVAARPLTAAPPTDTDPNLTRLLRRESAAMRHESPIPSQESHGLIYSMFLDYWSGKLTVADACRRFNEWLTHYNQSQQAGEFPDLS